MVSYRKSSPDEPAATALLGEYFAARAAGFPAEQGSYSTTYPNPAEFVPPAGVFLVVEDVDLADEPADVGCGGIRSIDPGAASLRRFEIKHLYLQPHLRGRGFGRALLAELERRALEFGAEELVLDTNASLEAAAGLYRSAGFTTVEPYNANPNATHWYAKRL